VALVAYILVVIWEYLTAFTLLAGAAAGARALVRRSGFAVSDRLCSLGWTMGVMLFLGGFLTVAGEWFRMWANKQVDASSAALQNFLIAAVGLILLHLPDRE
jgi:predicted small integral membrane protein